MLPRRLPLLISPALHAPNLEMNNIQVLHLLRVFLYTLQGQQQVLLEAGSRFPLEEKVKYR